MDNGIKGVYYYKLEQGIYPDDQTKRCSLNCCELDHNFNFLRGMDIDSMEYIPEEGKIYLIRLNGDKIKVDVTPVEIGEYEFEYDGDNGVLIITTPDKEKIELSGFATPNDVALSTTDKIIGDGTLLNPLDMESAYMTGTYRPVETLLDLTEGNSLPKDPAMHDRYVTKENINEAGYFYTYDEVKEIQRRLDSKTKEKSDEIWRVPRIEDWNKLLNSNEPCPGGEDYIKHGQKDKCNFLQGEFAGKMCKSKKFWKEWDGEKGTSGSRNKLEMNILPLGSQRDQFTNALKSLGTIAQFWSISSETPEDNNDIQGKQFEYDQNKVRHINPVPNIRITLRLVKNYNGRNYNEFEFIENIPVKTKLDIKSGLIWTETNVSIPIDTEAFKTANSEFTKQIIEELCGGEEDNLTKNTYYFVNQWNGNYWHKIPMQEGESVVIFEAPNPEREEPIKMHEWRLIKGELVDTADTLGGEFEKDFTEINEKLEGLEEKITDLTIRMEAAEGNIDSLKGEVNDIQIEIINIKKAIDELGTNIKVLDTRLTSLEEKLGDLNETVNSLNAELVKLSESLNKEIEERKVADKKFEDDIKDLGNRIEKNKIKNADGSIIVEYGETSTDIRVNLPADIEGELPKHIKVDNETEGEKGLYFDGFFGTF